MPQDRHTMLSSQSHCGGTRHEHQAFHLTEHPMDSV